MYFLLMDLWVHSDTSATGLAQIELQIPNCMLSLDLPEMSFIFLELETSWATFFSWWIT